MSQSLENLKANVNALTEAVANAGTKFQSRASEQEIQQAADNVKAATDALNAAMNAAS